MKSMIKSLMALSLAVVMILGISGSVLAASVTSDQAVNRAVKDAKLKKSNICALEVECDEGEYEIEFKRKSDRSEYDYKIAAASGKILEASADYKHRINRSKAKIGKRAAQKKAARYAGCKLGTVRKGSCRYKRDGREWVYKIRFKSAGYYHEIEVLAPTGKVVEAEKSLRR